VEYKLPTPNGVPLELRARVTEIKGRKVVVTITIAARGEITVRGEVVAVQMPDRLAKGA
jgi:predicted thioesterase